MGKARKKKEARPFDMSKYRQRHLAFHVQYDGGKYHGFADQLEEEGEETVERHIFNALIKLRLITDKKSCQYSRCGRTDRGVSALGQVIALKVRSSLPVLNTSKDDDDNDNDLPCHPGDYLLDNDGRKIFEIDYCSRLNAELPRAIRVLGWCSVTPGFSARFSAASRTYRYFFVKRNLDIDAMNTGAAKMVGKHDFRNLAKMDVSSVSNFEREIYSCEIKSFITSSSSQPESHSLYMLEITGIAFLWHQVRNIMAVLFLIGERNEQPSIVDALLNVEKMPARPEYQMASDYPLVLHRCAFDNLRFQYQPGPLYSLTNHYEKIWEEHAVAAAQAWNALQILRDCRVPRNQADELYKNMTVNSISNDGSSSSSSDNNESNSSMVCFGEILDLIRANHYNISSSSSNGEKQNDYVPLSKRKCADSYLERVQHLQGQKRDRYERHISLTGTAAEADPHFFKRMRAEGSVNNAID